MSENTSDAYPVYGGPYADEDDRINEAYRNDSLEELDTVGMSEGALNLIENMKFLKDKHPSNSVPVEIKETSPTGEEIIPGLEEL